MSGHGVTLQRQTREFVCSIKEALQEKGTLLPSTKVLEQMSAALKICKKTVTILYYEKKISSKGVY